jgi:glycosyltransferase involved in cell wall biosynthesis
MSELVETALRLLLSSQRKRSRLPTDSVHVRMTTVPTFSFVVPCFNEEGNVATTVGSVRQAMGARDDYEIILVNDASTDHTLERMQALAAADPHIRVLDNALNLGFGGSYKRGASAATATYVMMLPGDDGFPGQSIAEIVSHAGEADIIIPIVTNPSARSWFRAFASKGFTTLLNWTFWLKVGYYNGAVLQRNDLLRAIEMPTALPIKPRHWSS